VPFKDINHSVLKKNQEKSTEINVKIEAEKQPAKN